MITNIIFGTTLLILAIISILHTEEIQDMKKMIAFLGMQSPEERKEIQNWLKERAKK